MFLTVVAFSTDVRRIPTNRRIAANKTGPSNKTSQNKEEFGKEVKKTNKTIVLKANANENDTKLEDTNLLIPKLYEAYFNKK